MDLYRFINVFQTCHLYPGEANLASSILSDILVLPPAAILRQPL